MRIENKIMVEMMESSIAINKALLKETDDGTYSVGFRELLEKECTHLEILLSKLKQENEIPVRRNCWQQPSGDPNLPPYTENP